MNGHDNFYTCYESDTCGYSTYSLRICLTSLAKGHQQKDISGCFRDATDSQFFKLFIKINYVPIRRKILQITLNYCSMLALSGIPGTRI